MANQIKFYWNGVKVNGGKLQKAHYFSGGPYVNLAPETITMYAKGYDGFSPEIAEAFEIENNSDMQTDYFEKDRVRIIPTHPLYAEAKAALAASEAHYERRFAK